MDNIVNALPEFDPVRDLPDHFLMILYGMRRSGKTVLLKHMLESMHQRLLYHEVYLFCSTIDVNPDQYSFIPKSAQFADVNNLDYHLRKIIDNQKEKKRVLREKNKDCGQDKKEKKKMFENEESDEEESKVLIKQTRETGTLSRQAAMREIYDPEEYKDNDYHPVLLIMDDCVNENAVRESAYLRLVAIGGRHIDISCIILSQCVAGSASVPPAVRTQADMIGVVAQPRSRVERDLLSEQYLTSENRQGSKVEGLVVLNKVTEMQHRALMISTVSPSARNYLDYAYKYGPVPFPPCSEDFKMGTDEQWNLVMKKKMKDGDGKNLPNPFSHKSELPQHKKTGEYLRGNSEHLYW